MDYHEFIFNSAFRQPKKTTRDAIVALKQLNTLRQKASEGRSEVVMRDCKGEVL